MQKAIHTEWEIGAKDNKTDVAHMNSGNFYEQKLLLQ